MNSDAKEEYREWVFTGNCPCCFPYWDCDATIVDVWEWMDEFDAWKIFNEILAEEEYEG